MAPLFVLGAPSQSAVSLAYHPNGDLLAASDVYGVVNVWNLQQDCATTAPLSFVHAHCQAAFQRVQSRVIGDLL